MFFISLFDEARDNMERNRTSDSHPEHPKLRIASRGGPVAITSAALSSTFLNGCARSFELIKMSEHKSPSDRFCIAEFPSVSCNTRVRVFEFVAAKLLLKFEIDRPRITVYELELPSANSADTRLLFRVSLL